MLALHLNASAEKPTVKAYCTLSLQRDDDYVQ